MDSTAPSTMPRGAPIPNTRDHDNKGRDTTVLEIRNLSTEFVTKRGAFRAVDDVSLELHAGKTLCVVGESGSGKSVMSRSILQIVDPPGRVAAGQVLLHRHRTARDAGIEDTVDLLQLSPTSKAIRNLRGRDIAMIFQEPMSSLSPVHRIGDQVGEAIRLHERVSKKEMRERTLELLRKVEIPNPGKAIDQFPFEFSGGMRQRAMIAMALACNPTVLIADEPTTALDVTIQAEILDLIRSIQDESDMAVLFITHDMGVVAEIADEIAVMRYGKVVETGDVYDIFEAPQHPYTQRLLNSVKELDQPSERRLAMRQARPVGAPCLVSDGVTKVFGAGKNWRGREARGLLAVDRADLELRKGENLGIVGESGSGKTTLGRCLQRVYDVTAGHVLYTAEDGRELDLAPMTENQLAGPWRDIRTVFQDPFSSLNPRMTIGQIIAEPLVVAGKLTAPEIRDRVFELLELVGLPDTAYMRYPHAFSGGQRQRVSIARAIAPNPRIIIADEATSALDVSLRTQILDLLLDLQERLDLSFILISHDIAVIRYFCDRIAVMYRGRIVEAGDTEEVCRNPAHDYTRSLLSAVPVADPRMRGQKQRVRYTETT
ncbi:peptide/nickel transport system ATP-binding protein [Palleronia marisminoris]|uniref:Glutathione import ATP-binding protein GsiA n=1 Tax=Palleronia marisminoris TaxID=315423 RepID=A0A1Y5TR17_9RHOB|nr:ABC transporter ATP-binding protein [Palleronia marisminoris]SFH49269.1 peptide/nickel transport system ATP-binding protein [Palleronia marisminoris]SLN69883.1 Glutathione import ATP-binding protein GsiA [Palleronia marisminoris]